MVTDRRSCPEQAVLLAEVPVLLVVAAALSTISTADLSAVSHLPALLSALPDLLSAAVVVHHLVMILAQTSDVVPTPIV